MARQLYELCGVDPARIFSPFCWRSRMALAHKGLAFESIPWRFTEKQAIAFANTDKVPVLVDGARSIADSWAIACYLDDIYPSDTPLMPDRPLARFLGHWTDSVVQAGIVGFVVADIATHLGPTDLAYFTQSREKRFAKPLAEVVAGREARIADFRRSLYPLRTALKDYPFLGGAAPNYSDYTVFGAFQWARTVSAFPLLEADDPVYAWRARLLASFGGMPAAHPAEEAA